MKPGSSSSGTNCDFVLNLITGDLRDERTCPGGVVSPLNQARRHLFTHVEFYAQLKFDIELWKAPLDPDNTLTRHIHGLPVRGFSIATAAGTTSVDGIAPFTAL